MFRESIGYANGYARGRGHQRVREDYEREFDRYGRPRGGPYPAEVAMDDRTRREETWYTPRPEPRDDLATKLPCSCLDCLPCLTNFNAGIWIRVLYVVHLFFTLQMYVSFRVSGIATFGAFIMHLIATHMYMAAMYSNRPPPWPLHFAAQLLLGVRVFYYPH